MATLGDIQTAVSKRILDASNTAVSSSDVAAAINESIRYWKYFPFWFNQVSDTASLTLHSGTIPIPSAYLAPLHEDSGFSIEYSSMRYALSRVTDVEYNAMYTQDNYGLPCVYARVGQSFEVYPLPDQAYTVRREYLKEYYDIGSPAGENDFTQKATRLITLWTCANLSAELRRDLEMENYFRNAARDEYNVLQGMSRQTGAIGRVEIESFLT